ncbi:hypothetical protein PVAND_015690 [Polypedilum vanderplanki]|uniref:Protein TEX261 n=1 Tax=Polypedilum vanderplanki TaxID=319348 RepID=A0A9J6BDL7_POLVA|nr:hypothetical protein PVAND_015690 [Polypedilum vanderplanki]
MGLLYFLSYVGILFQICFVTIALAAGLYYISELVEEYSEKAKKIIKTTTQVTIALYLLFIFTENFPYIMIFFGILAQLAHLLILRSFPEVKILSIEFIVAIILIFVNHYYAYNHFQEYFYTLSEILGYFTLCLWLVPFSLFVSLSANDQVLPIHQDGMSSHNSSDDVVTNYFSSKKKKNLLNFFKNAKESLLPTRTKKSF